MTKNHKEETLQDLKAEIERVIYDREYVNYHNLTQYRQFVRANLDKLPKLYRYLEANYQTIRSLETGQLKLIQGSMFNDLFESMPVFKEDTRRNLKKRHRGELSDIADIHLIKSFTENENDILMWSHYGDGGKGFVVEYDLSKVTNQDPKSSWVLDYLYPVVYSQRRIDRIAVDSVIDDYFQYRKDSFDKTDMVFVSDYYKLDRFKDGLVCLSIVKSKRWAYEKEWRLSVPVIKLQHYRNNYDGIIDFDCISKVYCGPRMENALKDHIVEIINQKRLLHKDISLAYMKMDPKKYYLIPSQQK